MATSGSSFCFSRCGAFIEKVEWKKKWPEQASNKLQAARGAWQASPDQTSPDLTRPAGQVEPRAETRAVPGSLPLAVVV